MSWLYFSNVASISLFSMKKKWSITKSTHSLLHLYSKWGEQIALKQLSSSLHLDELSKPLNHFWKHIFPTKSTHLHSSVKPSFRTLLSRGTRWRTPAFLHSTVPKISSHEINIYIRTFSVFSPDSLHGPMLCCQSKASSWDLGEKKRRSLLTARWMKNSEISLLIQLSARQRHV